MNRSECTEAAPVEGVSQVWKAPVIIRLGLEATSGPKSGKKGGFKKPGRAEGKAGWGS